MKILKIRWQRLVDEDGKTCDRCGTTGAALEDAVNKVRISMKHLGIDVVLEKVPMVPSAFSKDTLQSNRIWVGDKAIEEWLSGTAGSSKCCSTCGEADCRTLILEGKTYEAIPAELIIRACLIAGSELLGVESDKPCCPPAETSRTRDATECCPPSQDRPK